MVDSQETPDSESSHEDTYSVRSRRSYQLHLASSFRRPSIAQAGGARPVLLSTPPVAGPNLAPSEFEECRNEERRLLLDSHVQGYTARPRHPTYGTTHTDQQVPSDNESTLASQDSETIWETAVKDQQVTSSWRHEFFILLRFASPLVLSFLLQSSVQFSAVFWLGHLVCSSFPNVDAEGTNELGASSLATMSSAITCYSVFQGIISSLDTLCSQAFGSGKVQLVGLHCQRCLLLLGLIHIVVAAIWLNAETILLALKQQPVIAHLVSNYLKVAFIGVPAYAIFEVEKRFLQAQGIFSASTRVLLITAPVNMILNYVLVYHPKFGFGFLGAPTAICITYWLQVILLTMHIAYIDGKQAWCGFSKRAFINWWPMVKLAVPGVVMVVSEWAAFEMLALAAAFISPSALAAQSVLGTTASILFQTPFAVGVAVSTRIGNLLGAGLVKPAKTASNVALAVALVLGLFTWSNLFLLRHQWGKLFSNDDKVIALVASILPLSAVFEIFDCFGAVAGGILRGTGKQKIGGYVIAYYILAMPVGLTLAYKFQWGLLGLWTGMFIALVVVVSVEMFVIFQTNWQTQADEAADRMEYA